jgi:hypothetical protein
MTPILVNKDKIYNFINRHPILVNELKTVFEQIPKYFPEALNIIVELRESNQNNYNDYDYVWIHLIIPENVHLFNEKWHLFYTDYLAYSYIKTAHLFRVDYNFPQFQETLLKED